MTCVCVCVSGVLYHTERNISRIENSSVSYNRVEIPFRVFLRDNANGISLPVLIKTDLAEGGGFKVIEKLNFAVNSILLTVFLPLISSPRVCFVATVLYSECRRCKSAATIFPFETYLRNGVPRINVQSSSSFEESSIEIFIPLIKGQIPSTSPAPEFFFSSVLAKFY